jgi:site-specific DNA-methyltransferase (adenine-specific)
MTGNAKAPRNVIFNANCIEAMRSFDRGTVDFILTDPPYVTRFRDRAPTSRLFERAARQ